MSLKNQEKQNLNLSYQDLVKTFYRSCDPSWVHQKIGEIERGGGGTAWVGEGASFSCYRLGRSGPQRLETVVLLGKPSYCRQPHVKGGQWRQALTRLSRMEHVLLPPLLPLSREQGVGYVMPYCSRTLPPEWAQGSELCELREELESRLIAAGLILGDLWQFRLWDNRHPLLIDFSDLQLIDSKPA